MFAAALGWLGTIGTFVAYLLLWRGHVTSSSRRYGAMNAVGGLLGGSASVIYGAWPSAASNFVWAAIGIHTVVTSSLQRSTTWRLVSEHAAQRRPMIVNRFPSR